MGKVDWTTFYYWHIFRCIEVLDRLETKRYLGDGQRERSLKNLINQFGLDEPVRDFIDPIRLNELKERYGTDASTTPIPHFRARYRTRQALGTLEGYRDFTEIVKLSGEDISSSYRL
jgi:hypothetical protein